MKAQTKKSGSTFTAEDLAARLIHRRAFEAVIWGMPAVNYDLMLRAMTGSANPNDPADVINVNVLQDAIKLAQPGGPGTFEVPKWDPVGQKKVRDALSIRSST